MPVFSLIGCIEENTFVSSQEKFIPKDYEHFYNHQAFFSFNIPNSWSS